MTLLPAESRAAGYLGHHEGSGMQWPSIRYAFPIVLVALSPLVVLAADRQSLRERIEADWLLQERLRANRVERGGKVGPAFDAPGGCDGIKNGKWGFHTDLSENPWWWVDLGSSRWISRVVIWNRCDGDAEAGRARRLTVQLADNRRDWRTVYTHDGTVFYGQRDNKPLVVELKNERARFVQILLTGKEYLHLDEIEIFGPDEPGKNLALRHPCHQVSASQWSTPGLPAWPTDWAKRTHEVVAHCRRLIDELEDEGVDVSAEREAASTLAREVRAVDSGQVGQEMYLEARWIQRKLALANPLLEFDAILFTKRVPGVYSHMSDQYYGWWSRPGGGIYILRGFKGDSPTVECLTDSFPEPGSFLRPMLSYNAKKVVFAWCKHYPHLAGEKNKLDKANVPEDAFYHVFEMNVDGTDVRQLTHGKYDDFDARYLPDGRILFLSTRRGQFVQCTPRTAAETLATEALPDIYVRCGGGPGRPVAVYTLHTINPDGSGLCPISPFEMFEWTPSVAHDGTILYSRWDYVDRDNQPWMSLWAMNPDGTNARLVYGNYTAGPNSMFEPRSIPNSHRIVFTGTAHHSQTMGSLVLLDPSVGTEGDPPVTRLTPHVPFPEIEGWPLEYYSNPWPLSERFHLVSWGHETTVREGTRRIPNGMGLYFFDAAGQLEPIYRDPKITSAYPIPLRPRKGPPAMASNISREGPMEGRFLVADVYRGLKTVKPGDIKALRIVAVPGKTHPTKNHPNIGHTTDDPGKCVLGTVPVEQDGSAYFRVPAGVIVFFQALDERGMAVQTMRGATHVQPGQTLSCIGCHESRHQAPPQRRVIAAAGKPSRITVGPEGSWPLRFDRLVQPVLDQNCVRCHSPANEDAEAAKFVLTPEKAYESLSRYGNPSLYDHIWDRYLESRSREGACAASQSQLLARITDRKGAHAELDLDAESLERLIVWMDTYAQKAGSFSEAQERRLRELRTRWADLLIERRSTGQVSAARAHPAPGPN